MNLKFLKRLKFLINFRKSVPFLVAFFKSNDVSNSKKVLSIGLVLAYILVPFDIIPDFLLGFGIIDDLTVLTLVLQFIVSIAPDDLKNQYKLNQ